MYLTIIIFVHDVFRAVSEPTRRVLLDLLRERSRPVQELAGHFEMSLPAVSQHLKVLREAGLVEETRQGRQRIYRLNAAPLEAVGQWLNPYQRFWTGRMKALGEHLNKQNQEKPK